MLLFCGKQNPRKVMIDRKTSEKDVLLKDFELALSLNTAFFFEDHFQILVLRILVSFCCLGFVFGVLYGLGSHGIHHHEQPPFGRRFILKFFPSIKEANPRSLSSFGRCLSFSLCGRTFFRKGL